MAHKRMAVTEKGAGFYRTRMMRAGEPVTLSGPQSRLYEALGYVEDAPRRVRRPQLDHDGDGREGGSSRPVYDPREDITALRAAYKDKYGKRPFNGWDAEALKAKVAEA